MGQGQRHGAGRWAALWAPSSPPRPDPPRGPAGEPRLDVKRMPQCLTADSVGTMASLMPLSPYLSPTVLLLVSCDLGFVRADQPRSPVNVTVTHLRANSATVYWDVPRHRLLHFLASTTHPSAPSACVLGTLSLSSITPTGDQSSPPRGGGIRELVSPGSSCPCHPTPWSAWMFESWDWCETTLLSHHLPAGTEWPWAACDPGGEHRHQGLCPLGTG
ncbi:uncharacterized protein LOC116596045 isoform X1 [Mustela erminea]|uniref:uncharacterized protein LOC116596045 isoform X1 n=1 Tax=Mustela erminea TaxID=36723 RepID=UPI001386E831|nr:uncharacterized protein LOC116596045 isoform X1 [Mustela erminea]